MLHPLFPAFSITLITFCACINQHSKNDQVVIKHSQTVRQLQSSQIRDGHFDSSGMLWLATDSGIYTFKDGTFEKKDLQTCNSNIFSITADPTAGIWFGTKNGFCRYKDANFESFDIPFDGREDLWGPGLNAKQVLCTVFDREGNLWFGTWGAGAFRYDGTTFTSHLSDKGRVQDDGTHKNVIQSILEDKNDNLWFTSMTHGGLEKLEMESGEWKHYDQADGMGDDQIFSSLEDRHGTLWFGCLGNEGVGLIKYDGNGFQNFNEVDGLVSNNVWDIFEAKDGRLLLSSSRGGMTQYHGSEFVPFIGKEGQVFARIAFMTQVPDREGFIFGGANGQLYLYENDQVADLLTTPNIL